MKWKTIILILGAVLLSLFAIYSNKTLLSEKASPKIDLIPVQNLFTNLQTDKSHYSPGDTVTFSLSNQTKSETIKIAYYHLDRKIEEQTLSVTDSTEQSWSWNPPNDDYKGYLAEITMIKDNHMQTETIAVDVSSDWSKFPRYGFLSEFGESTGENVSHVISSLNRYHINGLQFYDWHEEHQQPLKIEGNSPASHWQDVANRDISLETVKQYIDFAHQKNMKTMAYNLLYGSFENKDIALEWHLFKDSQHQIIDQHPLPDQWKSNVNIMNPTNPWWQDYIINQQKNVYRYLQFDGWHIDQLGDRGEVFNEWGSPVQIVDGFQPFLSKIKHEIPGKEIVMNAVNQYGQSAIAEASPSFLYTEVWDEYKTYSDLKRILDENASLSKRDKSSVLAAYMNYNHSNQPGSFNEAGILSANAVIFANGGAHLELGEHMLSKEYFPLHQLNMEASLQEKMIDYYDFLTAYENILRENVTNSNIELTSNEGIPLSFGDAAQGQIWILPKQKEKQKIIHFINFLDAKTMEWRDTNASQPAPFERTNLDFTIKEEKKINRMWLASPDTKSSMPIEVPFVQKGKDISFTLPSLTYWDMLVIEYEE
ncbi:glycoside hydrolase family 66 protein [Bacillus gobiensis]|uniref:glycoside hydrolase family 66 protein n=1 Tax=Bacillus gobiensis TaxID=1441095 RepID=UPI003D22BE41